jgi:CDP-4-dehydro-6-deoxyglucose reductase, E1
MKKKIPLVDNNITKSDIKTLIKFLKTNPRLSQGDKVEEFENEFSAYLGVRYSVFVNSGSSANLLMVYALMQSKELRNKKVVVPAIAWSTTVAPLLQLGLEPIICDVSDNLSLDVTEFKKIVEEHDPATLMLVHPLGFSTDMFEVGEICDRNDITLLEDTCESLGSDYRGIELGTFGLMSTFSFFVSHHITSIEGGMICTNDKDLYNLLKMLRSHGWDRDLDKYSQRNIRKENNTSDFDALYTFYYPSFNVRGTELNAVLGLEQLKRLDTIACDREDNFWDYTRSMRENDLYVIQSNGNHLISNFAYPIIHKDKEKIIKALVDNGIECRPIVCGNIANQPFLKDKLKYPTETPMADLVDKYGFYVPNHPHLELDDINYVINTIKNATEN